MNETHSDNVLSARAISKTYRQGRIDCPVLHEVDIDVRRGEFVAIMGHSGSGKSTLLHILGLMSTPTSATSVMIDGVQTQGMKSSKLAAMRRDKIGFVFQRFNLLTVLNAIENLKIAMRLHRTTDADRAKQLLAFGGLAGKQHLKPGQMSIGEQQRLAFARAIVHRPALLLADEPTGNLDSENAERLMELMFRAREELGQTIVMVTHNDELARRTDRTCWMKDGRLSHGLVN